jgi:hypothetical protein
MPFLTKNGRIEVYEASSGFYIKDTKTNDICGMGDGVDMFTDAKGNSLEVGSKAFYTAMRKMVRDEKSTLMEAYFGIEN